MAWCDSLAKVTKTNFIREECKVTKKSRLESILKAFNDEERELLESLGVKRLYRALDTMPDDNILIEQLRAILPSIAQKLEEVAKEKKESEKKEAVRDRARIETVEDVEVYIPRIGKVTIKKDVFKYFCNLFNFSIDIGIKKVTSLFIYYPKRMPLISININLNCIDAEYLLIDTIEDYVMLEDTNKNWSTFVGLFSKNVYSLLDAIGNKTIRRKRITIKENPCYVYNSNGELVKVIKEDNKKVKEEITHEMPIMVSWEMLKEKELI